MRVCPFCGTDNEVFFKFCLGCGADLDDALGPAEPEEAAPPVAPAAAKPSAAPAVASTRSARPTEPSGPPAEILEDLAPQHAPAPHRASATETAPRPRTDHPEPTRRPVHVAGGRLVLILEDGSDGAVYELGPEHTLIGRDGADISFPHDDFLAPHHAEFVFSGGQLTLAPLASTNGVFVQVSHEVELHSGDVFRIGQELLCFELLADVLAEPLGAESDAVRLGSPIPEGAWGRLGQLIAPATWGAVYLLGGSDIYLGRERGDITFPGDGFVSGLHAVIMQRDDRYFLKDLGSSNGTYYRLARATLLRRGALVLAGQQLFRVEH